MRTTRLLSALLLACMLVGLFSGCSGGGGGVTTAATTAAATAAAATTADTTAASGTTVPGTSYAMSDVPGMTAPGVLPIVTEPTTLTVGLIPNATVTDYEDNLFTKFVEENSGIDIEFYFFPTGSGEAKQKLQLMVASNQALPDIWSGIGMTAVEKYELGRDGYALDITPYMEKYAYFYESSLQWASERDKNSIATFSKSVDGKMYVMPVSSNDPTDNTSNGMYINRAWLDAAGLGVPTTTEELNTALIAFRDNDVNGNGNPDDEIPMLFMGASSSNAYQLISGWFGNFWGQYNMNVEDGQCVYPFTTDEYRQALAYMRDLVSENLLSPLSFTMTAEQYRPLIEVTDSGADATVGVFCDHPYLTFTSADKTAMLDYEFLPTLDSGNGKAPVASYWDAFTSFSTMIYGKTEHPEVAFRLLDWFCDEKTALSARFGEYGTHWKYLTDTDIDPDTADFPNRILGYSPYWVLYDNPFASSNNYVWKCTSIYMIATELFGSYISAAGGDAGGQTSEGAEHMSTVFREGVVERLAHQPDAFIADLIFTAEEQSQIAEIMTSIGTYQTECLTAFISGSMDLDSGWDNYVNTLKAMGLDTYISTAQTAYTRMMG